ncbi:MAG: PEGA domain-containing protein [bacterium]
MKNEEVNPVRDNDRSTTNDSGVNQPASKTTSDRQQEPVDFSNGVKPIEEIKSAPSAPPSPAPAPQAPPAGAQETPLPKIETEAPKTPSPAPPPAPPASTPPQPTTSKEDEKKIGSRAVIKRPRGGFVKIILYIVGVLILLAAGFYFFFYRVTLEINPSPAPDKILLDDKEIKAGIYKTMPGTHSITISKDGYVSYISVRNFKMAEKVKLNFALQKEKIPTLSVQQGKFPSFSSDLKNLFFLDKDSTVSVLDLENEKAQSTPLSNAKFPTAKIVKISNNNNYALILDNEAIKIVDFSKTDLINQTETKLPPLAANIHSVSWNDNASSYFPEANSKLIYDLLSSYGWDVFLTNLKHTDANIILQLDKNKFSNAFFDWGANPNKVLVIGGEVGVLDLSKREYQSVSAEKNFVWGKWGPNGTEAVVVDEEGTVYRINGENKLETLPFKSAPNLISFFDEKNIAGVSEGRPVKYNFDTKQLINYAEVKDLSSAKSFISRSDIFYFGSSKGIFSGKFELANYK